MSRQFPPDTGTRNLVPFRVHVQHPLGALLTKRVLLCYDATMSKGRNVNVCRICGSQAYNGWGFCGLQHYEQWRVAP